MSEPAFKLARRRGPSRWSSPAARVFVPGVPPSLPPTSEPLLLDAMSRKSFLSSLSLFFSLSFPPPVRVRIDELQHYASSGRVDLAESGVRRSPEPAPVYDARGVRVNTREKVAAEKLLAERQALAAAASRMHGGFVAAADVRGGQAQQLQLRIAIPFKEYPEYNFIGLIIGPRGLTQKQMEKDTGCKIAIRGKGSVKDGKQTSASNTDEPLHVMITAPDVASLRKAEGMVRKLVTPIEESQNEHKRAQLRKLAEFNGTLMGHEESFAAMTPAEKEKRAKVCRNCGGGTHATYECGQRGDRLGVAGVVREVMNREYAAFCRAVGEQEQTEGSMASEAQAEQAMNSFYEEIK